MATSERVLILGGGLIGLAIAHELARQGKTVEVLSRNRNEAAGFVAAGMLAPHAEGLKGDLLQLGQLSLKRIPKWVQQIENDSDIHCGLRPCGIVVPFLDPHECDSYATSEFGQLLNRKELEIEVPGIANKWQGGLLFEQDGQIDNRRRLMRALEKACVLLGVHFQEGVEVLELIDQSQCLKGIHIRNAEGKEKTLKAQTAVLCSGAWSGQLLKDLPITPIKGQMLSLQGPKNALKRVVFGPGTYLVPREDGLIIVGATSESSGFKQGLTPCGQRELQAGIKSLLPTASKWPPMERWWGFRPCSPDQNPLLGPSKLKGLWLATGHHRNGVLLAAITAEILSKKICNITLPKEEKKLLKAFHWNRF